VNFGSAFVGVAAGAVPPPPLSSVVVVVSVEVVSLDVVSVAVELDVESGVVVVIVVTTVELPVVIVVTIVVVASAWKGAAPAVNAAVAAPSVISTANAAPHTAYFLYCLLIPPPCSLDYKEAYPPGKYLFHPVVRRRLHPGGVPWDDADRLHAAVREARDDAAPFALAAAGILVALALVSMHAHWELLGYRLWWIWLIAAAPYVLLAATLELGLGRLTVHNRRREIVIGLLGLVWLCNALSVGLLVVSLVSHSAVHITGRQLLVSGFVVWMANVIAFGLAFWELDSGGPVARAMATARSKPVFQFPEDDNPEVAREGWAPRLWDYSYVSLTNAMAFSPTDAMPLTGPAKTIMAAESTLSAITILLVAARAVNIL
jgi:hypothetical protein